MVGWIDENLLDPLYHPVKDEVSLIVKFHNFSFKVASGAIPEFVTSQDIPSPISFEEAHARYATSVAAFITVQSEELFTDEEVSIMPPTPCANLKSR